MNENNTANEWASCLHILLNNAPKHIEGLLMSSRLQNELRYSVPLTMFVRAECHNVFNYTSFTVKITLNHRKTDEQYKGLSLSEYIKAVISNKTYRRFVNVISLTKRITIQCPINDVCSYWINDIICTFHCIIQLRLLIDDTRHAHSLAVLFSFSSDIDRACYDGEQKVILI
jgi:hypothetical protein